MAVGNFMLVRRSRIFVWLAVAISGLLLVYRTLRPDDSQIYVDLVTSGLQAIASLSHHPPQIPPRISIIVIWEGPYRAYLNNFFTSIRANADTVELIWIDLRKDDNETECLDVSPWAGAAGETNIKTICLARNDYWALHRDYFCSGWECTEEENESVLRTMIERNDEDQYKSAFRLWRGYVFRQFMSSSVTWWGWADPDTFMGNFASQFPWDATDYDVLIPAFEGALLYMRGHLCFFLARQETETKLNEYPTIRTMQAYIDGHHPWYAAEEGEYSAFVLRSPSINFLILTHHLVELMHQHMLPNTAKLSTLHGAYKMQWPGHESLLPPPVPNFPVLDMPRTPSKFTPTFSEQGATHPVELQESTWPWDVWIPKEHVNSYDIDWNFGPDGGMRMVGRGGGYPGGSKGVWERVEPSRPIIECHALHHSTSNATVWLIEGLYVHFFEEKHNGPWSDELPTTPLESHHTLATFFKYGAEIWDQNTGKVVWRGKGSPSS